MNPGRWVLIPEPVTSASRRAWCLRAACRARATSEQNGFALMPGSAGRCRDVPHQAVILPYPNNPTGAVLDRPLLERLRDVFVENDLIVISDEIYSELTYTEEGHTSIANLPGMRAHHRAQRLPSKAFAMTGWRMGYLCAPAAFTDVMCKIHQYTILCAPPTGLGSCGRGAAAGPGGRLCGRGFHARKATTSAAA